MSQSNKTSQGNTCSCIAGSAKRWSSEERRAPKVAGGGDGFCFQYGWVFLLAERPSRRLASAGERSR